MPHPPGFLPHSAAFTLVEVKQYIVGRMLISGGFKGYEPETLALAASIIAGYEIEQFADVGANIGVYSWYLKSLFGNRLEVRAYEPLPSLISALTANALTNNLSIDARAIALSDENGEATLYVSAKSDSSNSLNSSFRIAKDTLQVPVRMMDTDFVDRFCPRLVKIDTESTEPAVLRGGSEFIRKHRPFLIVEVLKDRSECELENFFDGLGYTFFKIKDGLKKAPRIIGDDSARDWLFSPVEDPILDYNSWRNALL